MAGLVANAEADANSDGGESRPVFMYVVIVIVNTETVKTIYMQDKIKQNIPPTPPSVC